jgi:alpha-galactosidase
MRSTRLGDQGPNREAVKGRGGTQLVLDLGNPKVQDFVFGIVDNLMTKYPEIAYIKWDANMPIMNHGSQYLPMNEQSHLYIAYHADCSGCASAYGQIPRPGDPGLCQRWRKGQLGYLPWFDEFWTSDNTDALQRVYMQWGTSYFFRPSPWPAISRHRPTTRHNASCR